MYSAAHHATAMIDSVGFLSALDTKQPPSVTKRFLTSQAWQCWFRTEVLGSSHPRRPDFMDDLTTLLNAVVLERRGCFDRLAPHCVDDFAKRFPHVFGLQNL